MTHQVRIVRLRHTPEEFVCDVIAETADTITVENPLMFGMVAQNKLGFQPWSPLSKDRAFVLKRADVLFVVETVSAIVNDFIEQTSKIKIVSSIPQKAN